MMKYVCLLLCLFLLPVASRAVDAVDFDLRVYQTDTVSGRNHLLLCDTATIVKGIDAQGFLLAMSIDIDLTSVDSNEASFLAHSITLGEIPHNYRNFNVLRAITAQRMQRI